VAAVLIGVVLGGGAIGGGLATQSPATGQGTQATRSVNGGKQAARRGQRDQAWQRLGFRNTREALGPAVECAAHSYGQVQEFFVRTPCRELRRMLVLVTDDNGGSVVVSVAWVRMRGLRPARQLRELADEYGTGNVAPIGGAALELGDLRFTGRHYESRRQGSLVVIAEAEPVGGQPEPAMLDALTEVAVLFPPP
jgi:hypothetical protein